MIIWAFNLLILGIAILVTGLIKPQLVLFWWEKKEPSRLVIVIFCSMLFMSAAIMFGEGNRQGAILSDKSPHAKPKINVTETPIDLIESPTPAPIP